MEVQKNPISGEGGKLELMKRLPKEELFKSMPAHFRLAENACVTVSFWRPTPFPSGQVQSA
jgi:hypothetical protein